MRRISPCARYGTQGAREERRSRVFGAGGDGHLHGLLPLRVQAPMTGIRHYSSARDVARKTGSLRVDPADIEQATTLVANDVAATLGLPTETAEALARREAVAAAEIMNGWEAADVSWRLFLARVVEETQQWLHDTFIDTTWPSRPEHGNHPLWLNEDDSAGWACAATNTTVCLVGQLGDACRSGRDHSRYERRATGSE